MIARQFAVFIGVGMATALLDVGILEGLLRLGVHYGVATTIAFFVALVFNYLAHSRVTFKAAQTAGSMFRYGVLVLLNYAITMAMVYASRHLLDSVLIGKVASIPVVTANGFVLSRYWVFRRS